ncbi:helix-turn-helix domain-containing protein [Halorarum halophilum]|uniref:Helix-turn-helix domain-containing protein n=1 Tax=Halorarum halophilum TaxID=2743090 RepID=A0A7D5H278_9EURY|nr:helix-turn-helix domain-containing protein [Halobaculum halophilum]QLG28993.1 helix-turn-helix domain-containing protein [Halobaculum halophilum]
MRHVRLTVAPAGDGSEVPAMYRVLSDAPYLDRVVGLHWNVSGDRLGLMVYAEGDAEAFRDGIRRIAAVLDFELVSAGDGRFYAYLRNELNELSRRLFGTFTRGSLLVVPPLVYGDGSVTFSVFGPRDEVQAAIEQVPSPFEVTVDAVSGMGATPGLVGTSLSARQREAVEVAIDVGYYEVPRQGDYETIAARMECAPSTAAEHLRKAESKVLRAAFPRG